MFVLSNLTALRVLYFVSKLNGLIPFTFSLKERRATQSLPSRIYCFTISAALSYFSYVGLHIFISITNDVANQTEHGQLYFVYFILAILGWLKKSLLSIVDFWQEATMIDLINEAFELDQLIIPLNQSSIQIRKLISYVYRRSSSLCLSREITLIMQFNVVVGSFLFVPFMKNADLSFHLFTRLYFLAIFFLRSTILFCGMLVVFQFFVQLNYRLKIAIETINISSRISKNMKMQIYCDVSDEIDRLSTLFTRCCKFYEKFNRIFAAQMLITLIYSFSIIVSNVNLKLYI